MKADCAKPQSRTNNCIAPRALDNEKCDDGSKGKILRVKPGYNPNSSSMGSIVFALPAVLLGVTVAFGAISGIITSAFVRRIRDGEPDKKDAPKAGETTEGPTVEEAT